MALEIVFEALFFLTSAVFFYLTFNVSVRRISFILFPLLHAAVSAVSVTFIDSLPFSFLQLFKPILILFFYTLFTYLIFKTPIPRILIFSTIVIVLNGIANAITFALYTLWDLPTDPTVILKNNLLFTVGMLITYLFYVILLTIGMFFIKENRIYTYFNNKTSIYVVFSTLLMFIINIGVYIMLLRKYRLSIWYLVFAVVVQVIYSTFMIYVLYRFQRFRNLEKDLQQQNFYNNLLINAMDNLRRFKHDIGNTLAVLNAMLDMNKFEQSKAYMKEVMVFDSAISSQTILLNVQNAAVNGLISSKLDYAARMNVKVNLKIVDELRDISNVSMMELCEALGILIDNAIEAVSGNKDNEVDLSINIEHRNIMFVIANTLENGSAGFDNIKKGISSKGQDRGNGLKIVNSIIKKNKCMLLNMHFDPDTNQLHQELTVFQD